MGEIRTNSGLIGALSELAARVQRGRTQEDVLRIAGEGVARLGMRFVVLQIDRGDLVLRYLATAPERYEALRIPLRHIESSSDAVPSSLVVSRPPLREPRSVPAFGGSATTTEPRFKTV